METFVIKKKLFLKNRHPNSQNNIEATPKAYLFIKNLKKIYIFA